MLSDIARITGHPQEACAALRELIRRYPENVRAGLAAYTLARVTTDSLHQPKTGALYYEQALALGVSRALRETALIRLIQVCRRTAPDKVQKYEDIYLADYPNGRYFQQIQQSRASAEP